MFNIAYTGLSNSMVILADGRYFHSATA